MERTGARGHYNHVQLVLVIVLALNWAVAGAKIVLGIMTRCSSMTADGFHSLSDGASNIIGLIGIAMAGRPVDRDHPYGHKKYETFFSLGIALLLFLLATNLAKEGVTRFLVPVMPEVNIKSFVVMIITMAVNAWVMTYEHKKGKDLRSDMLVADSLHTKADIFTSFSVLIALVSIKIGFPIIDPIVTLLISVFIAYAGVEIVREASRILCDTAPIMEVGRISAIVMEVKGVKACHKIRTRGRPDDVCVDLHVQVDSAMHINAAHKICYAIEEILKQKMPEVTDVLVHIEPIRPAKEKKKRE